MLLPHADQAIVDDAKLLDYVLNPGHPVGRHHAALFETLLGITRLNYLLLKEQLLRAATSVEVEPGKPSAFGEKFVMRFAASGPVGSRVIVAVWMREEAQPGRD
jgi:hypothetical protein